MFLQNIHTLLFSILRNHVTHPEWEWIDQKSQAPALELMTAFVAAPRFLSKQPLELTTEETLQINEVYPGFSLENWNPIRLGRVCLLMSLDTSEQETYVRHVETLFDTAEMNELVALYSALPLLSYPEKWLFRATEAVRSNVGVVFDALALQNPYPARHFNELAWNQLVLKTIFNDKPIHLISGLEERVNEKLALTLADFAKERWAAGRSVAAQVWRLIPPFVNGTLLETMQQLFQSTNTYDQMAAALACFHSENVEAKKLLANFPELEKQVHHQKISWADLEFSNLNTYVSER
ncbi:EboA domain-containing protein [Arundinibacter roseus]|uniref:EboA domain-containing protein n=1 Tax=Arundinibacter roseus TaxID=2070510 RepID=A0A4R4KA43_9BACT|nr:EboA domain-containing protein [Arundinibacter roseus]TDB64630.1 hypothetical protein EZE20_13250 [Arundinibacter roseus]